MIPVDQTIFGAPDGNCFSACVASLLEMPLADVPFFMGSWNDSWLTEKFAPWCLERGFYPLAFLIGGDDPWIPQGLHILSGKNVRGVGHSVVARGKDIVHDPNPDRQGLSVREDVIVLIPLDPRYLVRKERLYMPPEPQENG